MSSISPSVLLEKLCFHQCPTILFDFYEIKKDIYIYLLYIYIYIYLIYICLKKHSQNWCIKGSLKWPKIGLFGFLFSWFHFFQSTKANIKIMIEVGDCQNPWEKHNRKLKTVRLPWEDHSETQWNWVCHLISQYHFYVVKSKGRAYPKQPRDSSEVMRTKISHSPTE